VHEVVVDAGAPARDEHADRVAGRAQLGAAIQIAVQRGERALVDENLARLAVLAGPDAQQPVGRVDVGAVQRERLADPQPGAGQQPDQRLDRLSAQRRPERPGGGHQRPDLVLGVDVRRRAVAACRQELEWRDLGRRVDPVQVARKAAHRAHPLRQVGVPDPRRPGGPPQRGVDRDRRLSDAVHERREVGQHPALAAQLEPQRVADREVVVDVLCERGHAVAPGHGWTSAASARRSTLA
jgi:hypothetical protein